jgi:hypothetical protein
MPGENMPDPSPPINAKKRIIINICIALGIAGGIITRRLLQIEGIAAGAAFGAGGGVLGALVGLGVAAVLVRGER